VSVEDAFWIGLKEAAAARGTSVAKLVAQIADGVTSRDQMNLSSALRTFVLEFYRNQVHQHQNARQIAYED
jgi:predicted DNA-binding ribbon-helix-helix protein